MVSDGDTNYLGRNLSGNFCSIFEVARNASFSCKIAAILNCVTGWLRVVLGEGVELHLSDQRPKMTLQERRQMLKRIEELVREIYG